MLKIGVLGAARITKDALIKPARQVDGVEVTAIAARDRGRAQEAGDRHGIPNVFESYQEMLADPEIDAVYIPTPNGLQAAGRSQPSTPASTCSARSPSPRTPTRRGR